MRMKKSNLLTGILYLAIGAALLLIAILFDTKLGSLLYGFAGAGIGPGVLITAKYFYWNRPEKQEAYQERLEDERIDLHDERKVKLRDKAGRYSYVSGLIMVSLSIVVFSVLGTLEVVSCSKLIITYLGGFFLFQLITGFLLYRHLERKY